MKKANVSWSYIVWGLLGLLVLITAIALLFILTEGPREGIHEFGKDTEDSGGDSIIDFKNLIGKCDSGTDERRCSFGKWIECQDDKWVKTNDECNE